MRSPCQRDMAEAPGVVFRFPDKIATPPHISGTAQASDDLSSRGVSATVPGLNILPSSAGLPSGLGAKTAASVIAAAAAIALAPPPPGPDPVVPAAIGIHRSASNVLHYPELLSDLRDRLIQIHQIHQHSNQASSGVESDCNQTHPAQQLIKRARIKRAGECALAGARRSGLRGNAALLVDSQAAGRGSAAATERSRSEVTSSEHELAPGELAAGAAQAAEAVGFPRRHSIGAMQAAAAAGETDDDVVDVVGSESAASTGSQAALAMQAAGASRATAPLKRKREKDGAADRRSGSPHSLHHHQRFHPQSRRVPPEDVVFSGGKRSCASCGASSTPCWRPGLIDSMTLCNLCGLRYKKGRVYCAACSYVPTKTEIATGGASICRRCSSAIHMPAHRPPMPAPHSFHHPHGPGF
ncbi:DNA-binding transcription repressor [Coemansia sp. RSA 2322]|nr:DNA-binding transcription repressor [Coemansia sp. RSA 2322]